MTEFVIDVQVNKDHIWTSADKLQSLCDKLVPLALHHARNAHRFAVQDVLEASFLFTNDTRVQSLNKTYRGQDSPTNVLSFPLDDDAEILGPMLGDIVLSGETLVREVETLELTFDDHLSHLIIHGFLHLLGYDHIEDDEAEVMESLEIEILAEFGIGNPYSETVLVHD
ncbi:MAG: rRNA maturation RNase YbeY [Cohaesibacteraceae bacterium]|nr:rRNA maturation RNase YbeY [Cohaesibacteraceae bacterium]MBL4875121.1 rRNA maturation RNase YbeY [Cohaesibacteraceae bacterium]